PICGISRSSVTRSTGVRSRNSMARTPFQTEPATVTPARPARASSSTPRKRRESSTIRTRIFSGMCPVGFELAHDLTQAGADLGQGLRGPAPLPGTRGGGADRGADSLDVGGDSVGRPGRLARVPGDGGGPLGGLANVLGHVVGPARHLGDGTGDLAHALAGLVDVRGYCMRRLRLLVDGRRDASRRG